MDELLGHLTINPANTMDGQVNILGRIRNTMAVGYAVVPDLPASLTINPANTMDGVVNIEPPPTVTRVLAAKQDAFLRESRPTLNYGTTTDLAIGYDANDDSRYRALVQFDLFEIPPDVVITEAFVRLRTPGSHHTAQDITAHRVDDEWVETGVTWAGMPSYQNEPATVATTEPGKAFVEWDIRKLVVDWLSGDIANHGLMLIAAPETRNQLIHFYAREYGEYGPQLVITYEAPVIPASSYVTGTITVLQDYQRGYNELTGTLDVFQNLADEALTTTVSVRDTGLSDQQARLGVSKPTLGGNLSVLERVDLASVLVVRVTRPDDISGNVTVTRPDMPGSLSVSYYSDMTGSLSVKQAKRDNLLSTITVRQSEDVDLGSSISVIGGPNEITGQIRILSGFLRSMLSVAYGGTANLLSSMTIPTKPGSKYLRAAITVQQETESEVTSYLSVVGGPNDLHSSIRVISGNLAGSIGVKKPRDFPASISVSEHDSISGSLSVRQVGDGDLVSTISVYRGPNDIPGILQVISDWMRASIAVRYAGYEDVLMDMIVRQLDISELESVLQVVESVGVSSDLISTMLVLYKDSIFGTLEVSTPQDLPSHISVKYYDEIAGSVSVYRHSAVYGYVAIRQTGSGDLLGVVDVSQPNLSSDMTVSKPGLITNLTVRQTGYGDLEATLTLSQPNMGGRLAVNRRFLPGTITVHAPYETADMRGSINVISRRAYLDDLYRLLPPVLRIDRGDRSG